MLKNKLLSAMGGAPANYIEDVFSTYLYAGNGSTQTITNGIDLAGKGGLVWIKNRNLASAGHRLFDTSRGANLALDTSSTAAQTSGWSPNYFAGFNGDGFSLGATLDNSIGSGGSTSNTYASWTFREQPKFFDVVTYTGDGTTNRSISHNLGSAPGCVIVKSTSTTGNWSVYHRGVSPINNNTLSLQSTSAASDGGQDLWGNGATVVVPTSTVFNVSNSLNDNGTTYVAYLFAHNAGGFGLSGTDNVISCGSFTTDGSGNATVNLGYEPQWLTFKSSTGVQNWLTIDTMRGWINNTSGFDAHLIPNASNAETSSVDWGEPTATGFNSRNLQASATYIYIAIRRGPMKTPTSGTSVFAMDANKNNSTAVSNFPVDSILFKRTTGSAGSLVSRLTLGGLNTNATDAEVSSGTSVRFDNNTGVGLAGWFSDPCNYWMFRRAPGFFDQVCFTPTGSAQNITHNLGVAPELIIGKTRDAAFNWYVYAAPLGNTQAMYLNTTDTPVSGSYLWNNTSPTASVFSVGAGGINTSAATKSVAYLFASAPGVSKVGSYTGTGTTQQINCGFTAGARFVLIKRTDSTGDWYVWDSARGIVAGNDPYLLLNDTAAEVTSTDYVDTYSAGFEISSTAPAAINASGGTFIYLAIA